MFLFLSLLTSFASTHYEYFAVWSKPPNVWVCSDSNVDKNHVMDSLEYWKRQGHDYGHVTFSDWCPPIALENTILITSCRAEFDINEKLAITRIHFNQEQTEYIERIVIYMGPEGSRVKDVVKHELGHSHGIKHVEDRDDIMYRKVDVSQN